MDKSNKEFTPRQEVLINLNWLYEHDLNKFNLITALMESAINKDKISISMSLNKSTHIIKVQVDNYLYKDEFQTIEEANKLIDMVKYFKSIA